MEKEFVSYELAVKLKAFGFDEDCFACYTTDGELSYDFSDNRGEGHYFQKCSAPTFSQAFRWFREKHGLNGDIISQQRPRDNFMYAFKIVGAEIFFDGYNTHEEAELACLERLIDKITNKKIFDFVTEL